MVLKLPLKNDFMTYQLTPSSLSAILIKHMSISEFSKYIFPLRIQVIAVSNIFLAKSRLSYIKIGVSSIVKVAA